MSPRVQELYMNDVVYRFDKRRQIVFGVVLDTYELCAPDDSLLLCKGQIRVYWFNQPGREQVVMQHQVHLLSRSVVDGDIVRRLEKGKETQRGYCRSATLRSAVRIMGTNKVVENVDHSRFMALHPIPNTTPVCVGELFGRIISCDYIVRLKSRDGSLLNYSYSNNTFGAVVTSHLFNKGSTVDLVPANLKPVKWMKKTRTMERNMQKLHTFHVRWVKPLDVTMNVHSVEGNFIYNVPKQDLPKLKVLKTLEVAVPRFNETRTMHVEPDDEVMPKWSWIAKQTLKHRADLPSNRKNRTKTRRNSKPVHILRSPRVSHPPVFSPHKDSEDADWVTEEEEDADWTTEEEEESPKSPRPHRLPLKRTFVVEALCTEAKATVIWQDGTIEEEVPTTQLYYSLSLDDHEFFPGEWVTRADEMSVYGVVQKASYLERTALVKWFTYNNDENVPTFSHLAEVSVYDIKQHPTFMFRPGGVVHRTNMCPNNIGTVVDSYPEGFVRVLWVSGKQEDCWPQHISILLDVKLVLGEDSEDDDAALSLQLTWETESVETMCGDESMDTAWHLLAKRLQFIRSRIVFLRAALLNLKCPENAPNPLNFSILKCLLSVYENSIYLDKLLDTQYFSIRGSHYQALLAMIKEKAKEAGEEIHSKLSDSNAEIEGMDSFDQLLKLEDQLQKNILKDAPGEPSTPPLHRDPCCLSTTRLCIELLSMIKCRLDLSFAEVVARMCDFEVTKSFEVSKSFEGSPQCTGTSTPMPSSSSTPEDSLTSISNTPSKLGDCNLEALNVSAINWSHAETSPAQVTSTPEQVQQAPQQPFEVLDEAPMYHRFYSTTIEPTDTIRFYRCVTNENKLLSEALPPGVWVYAYADRMDLYSVMIRGPNNTPYEDGLFIFDLQLGADYPRTPPQCNYISYTSERLNPNLYVEGKVCVSLLGTWVGCGTEVWGPKSTLLQLIVSIQGLILVTEPYYNEAGYEKQCKSQQGYENSRTYNELVLLLLVQSMTDMCVNPYRVFRAAILAHFRTNGGSLLRRLGGWIDGTYSKEPEFSLLPVSKGLKLSLRSCLDRFKEVCDKHVGN